jgi:hypothetical protein
MDSRGGLSPHKTFHDQAFCLPSASSEIQIVSIGILNFPSTFPPDTLAVKFL